MTNIEAKRIIALGKKHDIKVATKADTNGKNRRIVIINGFVYDDAAIAATDIINQTN